MVWHYQPERCETYRVSLRCVKKCEFYMPSVAVNPCLTRRREQRTNGGHLLEDSLIQSIVPCERKYLRLILVVKGVRFSLVSGKKIDWKPQKKIICWISSEAEQRTCKAQVRISKFLSSSNISNILHIVFGSVKPLDYSIKTQSILFPCFWCVRENKVHLLYILYTPIAQLVEQQIFNLFVVGSIPTGRTKEDYIKSCGKGIAFTL